MGKQLSIENPPRLTRLICAEEGKLTIHSRGSRDGGSREGAHGVEAMKRRSRHFSENGVRKIVVGRHEEHILIIRVATERVSI